MENKTGHSNSEPLSELVEILTYTDFRLLIQIAKNYKSKWHWGAGPEYLYRELVRAYGLTKYESVLIETVRPKPGRKKDDSKARLVVKRSSAAVHFNP